MTAVENNAALLEKQVGGFKASFGGEELRRATATLAAGAAAAAPVGSPLSPSSPRSPRSPKPAPPKPVPLKTGHVHVTGPDHGHGGLDPVECPLRELLCEAHFYSAESEGHLCGPDFDTLYSHGLVLQELARASDENARTYLKEACDKYVAALQLQPDSHVTLYNLGVALSDQARVLRSGGDNSGSRSCLRLASHMYARALEAHPASSQTLNNWGLILHELSTDPAHRHDRDDLVRAALGKFRCALRAHPDFDRSCYNLGTVCHAYASTLQQELSAVPKGSASDLPGSRQARESLVRRLFSTAAQYICLAWALHQQKDVYRKSLGIVKSLLPLPFLRAGMLTAPLVATLGTVDEVWERQTFVLDHVSLRAASLLESSLSSASAGHVVSHPASGIAASGSPGSSEQPLVIPLAAVTAVRRCCDPSLPMGEAFWVSLVTDAQGIYLVAEDEESADAWVDALLLSQYIVCTRGSEALAEALAPSAPHPHPYHHTSHGHLHHHPSSHASRRGH